MGDDNQGIDPASILRAIDDDRRQAELALAPNARLLYAVWGIAWIVGFLAVYATLAPAGQPVIPVAEGVSIGVVALIAAMAVSTVHSVRRGVGSRGPSRVLGAIVGYGFTIAFLMAGLLGWRLTAAGVAFDVMLSYWVAVPCLIVGTLTLADAAMSNDRSQLIFGIWTCVAGLGSILVVPPHNLLAGVVGGIGFLALAVVQSVRPGLTSGPIVRATDG